MVDISDIKASIQCKTLIQDEFFKNAEFLKDSRGRLISYTGGYTVVIPSIVNGEKWAFRCWHFPVKDSKKRYALISEAIHKAQLPFFCSFEYAENGLLVKGESLPTTKMKWVEGKNLKQYICAHCNESTIIKTLARDFLDMVISLHTKGIAHGDLQHGNIIVSESGELFLVDYDSMYVPAMEGDFPDIISGLIDYQHPARKNNKFSSERVDYFSELVIYTSLLGIAEDPTFVSTYKVEDSEGLLFSASDFGSLETSKIYNELKRLKNADIDRCLAIILEYLSENDLNALKPIESYLMSIDIKAPNVVPFGEPFTLRWISSGAKQVSILGIGDVELDGQQDMTFSESSDITFVLTSATGLKTEKVISVKVAKRGVINSFETERAYTFSSVPVRISWACTDMTFVELVGYGKQPTTGSLEVEINQDKTFELRTKDHFTTYSQTIIVRVLPYPSIKTICVPKFEVEHTNNITIHNAHLDIRPLVSKVNTSFPIKPTLRPLTIHNPKIVLPRSLVMFSGEVKDTMRNLFNITTKGFTQIVNQIKQVINERD